MSYSKTIFSTGDILTASIANHGQTQYDQATAYTDSKVYQYPDNAYTADTLADAYNPKPPITVMMVLDDPSYPNGVGLGTVVTHWNTDPGRGYQTFVSGDNISWTRETHPAIYPAWSDWKMMADDAAVVHKSGDDMTGILTGPAFLSDGYKTGSTANTNVGSWMQIAALTITAQYADSVNYISIMNLASGSTSEAFGLLYFRVKQQATMGSAPYIDLKLIYSNTDLDPNNIVAVTTTNSASQTVVKLFIKMPKSYDMMSFLPYHRNSQGLATISFSDANSYQTSLPSGAQTTTNNLLGVIDNGSGIISMPKQSFVDVSDGYAAGGFSVPNATETKLDFRTDTYPGNIKKDVQGEYSASGNTVTLKESGVYMISGGISTNDYSSTKNLFQYQLKVVSGPDSGKTVDIIVLDHIPQNSKGSNCDYFQAGDVIQFQVYQSSGATITLPNVSFVLTKLS